MDEEVSTDKAIKIFMDLEQKSEYRTFKPPEVDTPAIKTAGNKSDELPSVKIARLQKELDELQGDLIELEKEEIPNNLKVDPQGAKQQMSTINELRQFMHKVVESTHF